MALKPYWNIMMLNKARQILQKFYGYEDFRPGQKKVVESLLNRKTNLVFTEGESRRIGNIVMPKYMYDNLLNSQKIYINMITKVESYQMVYSLDNLIKRGN